MVRLQRRAYPRRPQQEAWMFEVVRASFQMRRKTLFNNLCAMPQMDRQGVQQALVQSGIDPSARGETLDIDAFIALSDAMLPYRKSSEMDSERGAETVPPLLISQALHAQRHKIAAVDLQLQFDLRIAIGHQANVVVSGLDIGGRGAGRQRFCCDRRSLRWSYTRRRV